MTGSFRLVETQLGQVLLAGTDRGLAALFLGDTREELTAELARRFPELAWVEDATAWEEWLEPVAELLAGREPRFPAALDLHGTAFQQRVWQELQGIPFGTTRTYSEVAERLGKPRAVRAVGRACATNPISLVIPCHRVLRSDGSLGGYRWDLSRKRKLLELERSAGAPASER